MVVPTRNNVCEGMNTALDNRQGILVKFIIAIIIEQTIELKMAKHSTGFWRKCEETRTSD